MYLTDFSALLAMLLFIMYRTVRGGSPVTSRPGSKLINHVIASFQSNSFIQCIQACMGTPDCYSYNQYPGAGLCELNRATHLSHPWDVVSDPDGSYMIYNLRPYRCSYSLCQEDEMCEVKPDGMTYTCRVKRFNIYVRSETFDDPSRLESESESRITVDGQEYFNNAGRGWTIVVFHMNGTFHSKSGPFDTRGSSSHAKAMAEYLTNLPNNTLVIATVEVTADLAGLAESALRSIGARDPVTPGYREAWCIVGYKGGNRPWIRQEHSTTDITEISVTVP
ncbi:uncharacterized protein LOC125560612 [Nematostella vectensis]|uniref:uncharacterized protein LOC125560612 n=1 Tax=Nematostella vectensis TaxID=45351 RepID=UPI0020773141|nr:uncharacterized protein LOC125560612 [Nematostella vectensis]